MPKHIAMEKKANNCINITNQWVVLKHTLKLFHQCVPIPIGKDMGVRVL